MDREGNSIVYIHHSPLIRRLTTEQDLRRYNEWVLTHLQGSLWQSIEWKKLQEVSGKEIRIYESGQRDVSALVVIDRTIGGFSTWEIPRGPLWSSEQSLQELIQTIIADAKKDGCIQIFLSPCDNFQFSIFNFQLSHRHVYPTATRILDLTLSEDQLLAQMHPKGRYNIGVAQKHGVVVETRDSRVSTTESDVDAFYGLLRSTAERDRFRISQKSHYMRFLTDLEGSFMLMARHQGKPVAGLIGVRWNKTSIYYYGASSYDHRQLMAPYLLQWEAMKLCKQKGCTRYDLLGIAASDAPDDPWAGISDFKRKFGGTVVTYPPEQVLVLRPVVKMVLAWKRKILG